LSLPSSLPFVASLGRRAAKAGREVAICGPHAVHNPILTELFDGFVPRSRQAMIDMLRMRGAFGSDADQEAHARLLDAIAVHDGRTAAELSRAHLLAMKERLR
jgi:DNA-binding FadR family transcriptional regulator